MRKIVMTTLMGLVLATTPTVSASAGADAEVDHRRWCEESFDRAQRTDMESFRDYDAETFRSVHHPDAVSIFATGSKPHYGVDAIMTALSRHFTDRQAVFGWTELSRQVHGCTTALIIYETTYEIPSSGYRERVITSVAYVFSRGHWKVTLDQGTLLELG